MLKIKGLHLSGFLWALVATLLFCFAWMHVKYGFIYSYEGGVALLFPFKWFNHWDYTRFISHFFDDLIPFTAGFINRDFSFIAKSFAASSWILFSITFLCIFIYLKKSKELGLLCLFPFLLCATMIRGFIFTELTYTFMFLTAVLILLLTNAPMSKLKVSVISILLAATAFTHQAAVLIFFVLLIYFAKDFAAKENIKKTSIFFTILILILMAVDFCSIFLPELPSCRDCRDHFGKTLLNWQDYEITFQMICFFLAAFSYNSAYRKLSLGLFALWGLLISYGFNTKGFYILTQMWDNRVFSVISFSFIFATLLFWKKGINFSNQLKVFFKLSPIFCIISLILSLPYLFLWKKNTNQFYSFVEQADSAFVVNDYSSAANVSKDFIIPHSAFYSSIFAPIFHGEDKIKHIFLEEPTRRWHLQLFKIALTDHKLDFPFSKELRTCFKLISHRQHMNFPCVSESFRGVDFTRLN